MRHSVMHCSPCLYPPTETEFLEASMKHSSLEIIEMSFQPNFRGQTREVFSLEWNCISQTINTSMKIVFFRSQFITKDHQMKSMFKQCENLKISLTVKK